MASSGGFLTDSREANRRAMITYFVEIVPRRHAEPKERPGFPLECPRGLCKLPILPLGPAEARGVGGLMMGRNPVGGPTEPFTPLRVRHSENTQVWAGPWSQARLTLDQT
ncbi:unnamed protein product [Cuscuta campestris]|uniref:Uncharacterized protein n=1 Tax=Cuscuta campestris TaxID=132261 RepID=A0A484L9J1_9ASTE|nr:unnamed protein product [Cuscuta campestris]